MAKRNNKLPISVFIITKNEEDRLAYTINSVRDWVDEIIVVDSGSTDNTVKIATELGADKVIYHEWPGYGPQKCYAESLCKNKWLFNLDADEEVSDKLAKEIQDFFMNNQHGNFKGLTINAKIVMRFKEDSYPSFLSYGNRVLRLYNKNYAGFRNSIVHDSVIAKDDNQPLKIYNLKAYLLHRSFRSFNHHVEKINYYSTMQAQDMYNKGRKVTGFRIIIEPFFAFFKAYIMRRYFIFGIDGFAESYTYAFGRMLRLIKLRELINKN